MTPSVDYQVVFRALPDLYVLFAPDSTILDHTDQHVESTLVTREQTVGRYVFDAYPSAAESQQLLSESLAFVRVNCQPDTMALRYDLERPADQGGGTDERHWELTHQPILDEAGALRYILQRPQDVTHRVRTEHERAAAEAALAEQRSFTDFVLDALPLIVWTARPDGTTAYLNRGWYTFTGQDPTVSSATLDTAPFIHPDDLPVVMAAWQRATATGTIYQFEYRLRRSDGEYRWLLGRAAPRHDAATGQITLWAGCATDIHQQRTLARELEIAAEEQAALVEQAYQTSREARHQRDTFYGLFQQAPAMISIVRGPDHRYEFVNPAYQNVFPGLQFAGRTVAEVVPEITSQGIIDLLDDVYRTGETYHGNEMLMQFDNAVGGRDDKYFNFTYQQFREADGTVAGIQVFGFEVTELVRARRRLEHLTPPPDPTA